MDLDTYKTAYGKLHEEPLSLAVRQRLADPVPLNLNTLTALKRCSLGLDLYLWLVYRTFTLRAPLRLSWRQVYRQFAADATNAEDKNIVQMFRRKVLRELKKIKLAWSGLNYSTALPTVQLRHASTGHLRPGQTSPQPPTQ